MRRAAAAIALLGLAALACSPPAQRPSGVLLIVVDTLRADHLGLYGYARPTSPAIDARAARGAVFERAFASSPWTLPSFASLYTGRQPGAHGAGTRIGGGPRPDYAPIPAALPMLSERLRDNGFLTGALVANPFLHPVFGTARGFEQYAYLFRSHLDTPHAGALVDHALRWLSERGEQPFFLMLHLMDPHMPYDPPEGARGRFTTGQRSYMKLPFNLPGNTVPEWLLASEGDRAFVSAAYDEEILGVDQALARLFEALDRDPRFERLLVVLTSDHGEELFDHGGFEHGHALHQELLRIPLIVWAKGVRPARIATPVSHVDLLPTLLDALGLPLPGDLDGVSLWPLLQGGEPPAETRLLVAERMLYGPERRALVRWPWKSIATDGAPAQLYDLAHDPGEASDLSASRPDQLAALRAAGEALARAPAPARGAGIDAATRQQLESLGYAD
jgi:arylsulfatase A-like enzyme